VGMQGLIITQHENSMVLLERKIKKIKNAAADIVI
jgi:hypothetical protein